MEYICKICNKKYASNSSLWNHNNKFHNDNRILKTHKRSQSILHPQLIRSQPVVQKKIYKCDFCEKIYANRNSKYKHKKTCKEKEKKENEKEKEKENNNTNSTNNTNNTNNINTNYGIINHININKIGTADMNYLTNENINDIFSKEIDCIFTFVELLHFNKNIPENHNHCTTNLSSKYLSVYNSDTKKIEKDRKKYIFDTILCKSIDLMELLFAKNKFKFKYKRQQEITQTIDTLKNLRLCYDNKKLFNEFINKLDLISYNNRKMVTNTWSNKNIEVDDDFAQDLENTSVKELLSERQRRGIFNEDDNKILKLIPRSEMKYDAINLVDDSDD